ncbi:MAG TPA: hypothetical protein VIW03_09890, partial [Anaeromyxobacter sp.]
PPVAPGSAMRYRLSGLPATLAADEAASVTLTALDQYGQVAVGYAGTAALSTGDAAAVVPATAAFTSGVASVTVRFRTAGRQTLTAADGTIRGTSSTVVQAGAAAQLRFTASPATATAGSALSPVTVTLLDAFGNQASASATVTLSLGANPGSDTLLGTTAVAASGGVAAFGGAFLTRAAAGYTLVATATGLASDTSAPFTVVAASPAKLALVQGPAEATAGEPLSPAPVVEVRDLYDNLASSGAPVTVSLVAGPTGAALSGTTTVAPPDGIARFDDLTVNKAGGGYLLVATSGFLASAYGAPFPAVAGAPHRAVFVAQPGTARAGVALAPPPEAMLLDRFDNPSLAATTGLSLSFASNPSLATLLGEKTVTASAGVATFPGVAIDRSGAAFALYVGAAGLVGDTSVGFDVLAGPAAHYAILGPLVARRDAEVSYELAAEDAFSNPVPDYLGTAAASSSDPAAGLPAIVGFTGGRAHAVRVTFRTAGPQTLMFTENAGGAVGSVSVTVEDPSGGGGGCHCGNGGASALALLGVAAALRGRRRRAS